MSEPDSSTSSSDFSPRRKKETFSSLIDFFRQELACLPSQTGIPASASEIAQEMADVWKAAGFTFSEMEKQFLNDPSYPLKEDDPRVLEKRDWFSRMTNFLSGSDSLNIEKYDAHCLIMSTLKYFNSQHAQHPRVLARNEVFQEESRRMLEADARTLFVTLPHGFNSEIRKIYEWSTEIALASRIGKRNDLMKLVFFQKEHRDAMEKRVLRKKIVYDGETIAVVPNDKFNWSKELLKEKFANVLTIQNLFVGDDEEDTTRQLSNAFPDREKVTLIKHGTAANVYFRSSEDATAAFWKAADVKINSGVVSVFFKKKF